MLTAYPDKKFLCLLKDIKNILNSNEEIDLLKDAWNPICVDGIQWYVRDTTTFNNSTVLESSPVKYYKQGVLGSSTTTIPTGNIVAGECIPCRKEIFAVHDRFISVPSVPVGSIVYEMTNDLSTQGLDVSNSYFHLIYPTLNGTASDAIGTQLTEYFANPQDGILFNDIAGIQAVIDFVLPSMGLSVGDITYAINTSNLPIFLLNPTAVTELANNTYLHIYWGDNQLHNGYNKKADVNVISANPNMLLGGTKKCVSIQEIKEKDNCTREETYRYVIKDLNGSLVKVSSIYLDFLEADVLLECNCTKVPKTTFEYQNSFGAVNKAVDYREVEVFNRNSIDIQIDWVSVTGNGSFIVPAQGTKMLSLTDNEGLFTSMRSSTGLYGVGGMVSNKLVYNFKN